MSVEQINTGAIGTVPTVTGQTMTGDDGTIYDVMSNNTLKARPKPADYSGCCLTWIDPKGKHSFTEIDRTLIPITENSAIGIHEAKTARGTEKFLVGWSKSWKGWSREKIRLNAEARAAILSLLGE
jgi:hypothetical protein